MIKKIEKCPEIGKIYSDNEIYIICTGDGNVCVLNTFSGTVIQSNNPLFPIGYHGDNWKIEYFYEYQGKIIIPK